jgi:hypothetical protein
MLVYQRVYECDKPNKTQLPFSECCYWFVLPKIQLIDSIVVTIWGIMANLSLTIMGLTNHCGHIVLVGCMIAILFAQ